MTGITKAIWNDLLDDVKHRHPDLVRAWFAELEPLRLERGLLEIRTRNDAQTRYLERQCRSAFVAAAQAVIGRLVSVAFVADTTPTTTSDEPGANEVRLNPGFVLESFAVGTCNRMAHAAALAAADDPGKTYNPLLVHGAGGLGKTHLLQAICHRATERNPSVVCRYVPAEGFIASFIEAFESESLQAFRDRFRHADLLAIDDVGGFAGRDRSQEELFHTINAMLAAGRQVIAAADRPLGDIAGLEARLVSRFSAGLVVALDLPCFETRLAILELKARGRCIEAPGEALHQLAQRITTGGGDLENALTTLDAAAQRNGGRITVDMVRELSP